MGRAMAVELAPRIRVVTISPGAVLTKNTENLDRQRSDCRSNLSGAFSGEEVHYRGRDCRLGRLLVRPVSDLDYWLQLDR